MFSVVLYTLFTLVKKLLSQAFRHLAAFSCLLQVFLLSFVVRLCTEEGSRTV